MKKSILSSAILVSSLLLISCGGGGDSSTGTQLKPSPVPGQASVASPKANIAIYGVVNKNNVKEVTLKDGRTGLLLDDGKQGISYSALGIQLKDASTLAKVAQNYLQLIKTTLNKQGATTNVLVNQTNKNTQSDVVNITLDVDFSNTSQTPAYVRALVLQVINSNTSVTNLPTTVSETGQKIRLKLSFWQAKNTILMWSGAYLTSNGATVQKAYGDINIATALTSASAVNLVSGSQSFAQSTNAGGAVDILWSIDASGSMGQEQANLAAGALQFFNSLNNAGVDYRLAVNTHDGSICKNLRTLTNGKDVFIDKNTPNALNEWKKLAQPGTNESATETGFYCVREANLTNFDRANAKNLVVFVSDEPENETASSYAPRSAPTGYVKRDFNDYKAYFTQSGAKYFAIVGTGTVLRPTFADSSGGYSADAHYSCRGDGGSASGGAHFSEISRLTGGSSASICAKATDWSVMFSQIIQTATGIASNFKLKQLPIPSTVVVKVNGAVVARDVMHQKGFDVIYSDKNATLVFYGSALPKAGDKILVEYKSLKVN